MSIVPTGPSEAGIERPSSSLEPSSALQQFARDAQAVYAIAVSLAPTPFVPTSYKKQKDRWLENTHVAQTVAAAILAGSEIGLSPMQSLQGIDIIEGRPALSALAQRALVQAHGHEVWVHERVADARGHGDRVSVTVRGRRKDSEHIAESTWSLDRARQAGLLGKTNWQNHPEAMCFARASADVCRQIAADVLMGLAYSTEELEDEEAFAAAGAGEHSVSVRPKEVEPAAETPAADAPEEPAGTPSQESSEADTGDPAQPEEAICGEPKEGEPTKICSRPFQHGGRHHFGKEISEEEAAARAPAAPEQPEIVDPEKSEPELEEGLEDPERCTATNSATGVRCALKQGHEGAHVAEEPAEPEAEEKPAEPMPDAATVAMGQDGKCPYHRGGHQCTRQQGHPGVHRADSEAGLLEWGERDAPGEQPVEGEIVAVEGEIVVEDPPGEFKQPSDEEQAAAFEAEQAARAEQPAPTAEAAETEALPVEDPDDPWADFS